MPHDEPSLIKSDYEALAAFRMALRRFLRFSEEAARAEGVTPQQHQLLLAVKGQPGRDWALVGDLADALQIHHNAAVGLVGRTESAGFVRRDHAEGDRRQVRVTLTPEGEEVLAHLSRLHLSELQEMKEVLSQSFLNETERCAAPVCHNRGTTRVKAAVETDLKKQHP